MKGHHYVVRDHSENDSEKQSKMAHGEDDVGGDL